MREFCLFRLPKKMAAVACVLLGWECVGVVDFDHWDMVQVPSELLHRFSRGEKWITRQPSRQSAHQPGYPGSGAVYEPWPASADACDSEFCIRDCYSTASYLVLAAATGNTKAVRAVASANGDNAIAIAIPCHRIIESNGDLGGYGGGKFIKNVCGSLSKVARLHQPENCTK